MTGIATQLRQFECLKELGGCGAQPGGKCVTRSGTQMAEVHAARWDQSHADKPLGEALGEEASVDEYAQIESDARHAVARKYGVVDDRDAEVIRLTLMVVKDAS